ncbi:hypothetical protein IE81DRAFT_369162 [Ceraceosorus guamensis]|uniref:Uncharacterized protein n=1 Tax=Ceraceosorus guamensis TaxID=1522189 RepID=A0A316VV13_9BASI|nr:hypothetical protein IE81DRAFT_369162 [Ceraceosorus guamensis]PWN39345.1 hypothetical protein IE81DRAFT_369162 [Ceraceosorus guamensis]
MADTIDNKFPNPFSNPGPEPSAENPGGVHPHTQHNQADPNLRREVGDSIGRSVENTFALGEKLNKLESVLDEVIGMFEAERETLGREGDFKKGKEGIELFKSWKHELERIKRGID